MIIRSLYLLFLILLIFGCNQDQELQIDFSNFQIQEGYIIELIAAEPIVMDPVAMEIDENGNLYVVEMPGYPLDISGSGRIKLLKDEDGDGVFEKSVLFAEDLILPTGILRWKDGFVVTDAPDVLYLEDTDGDGKADKREVMLTGFSRSNPQHNLNSPKYGLDNWIYLGHEGAITTKTYVEAFGDRGKQITFPDDPNAERLPVNANNRAVRFQPDSKKLEMLSGKTQFGFSFDDWGHLFYNSNADHLFHEVIAARYLLGKENLPLTSTRHYIPDYGPGAEIYPITLNPEHQVLTDVGTVTSACGITLYQGGAFPVTNGLLSFIADPVHNLVHTDLILDKGATFLAKRHIENREFLASKDSWFRPVNFYIGPEGELYVIDYYRQFVEHPEWMAKEVVESGQLYNGIDKGRIYKITAKQQGLPKETIKPNLGDLTDQDLIPYLAHENIWWRRNAQRLLVEHKNPQIIQEIIDFGQETQSALGLLHTMWTLEGMGSYDTSLIRKALKHSSAGLRENALKIFELHDELKEPFLPDILTLKNDPDPKVRFQLLCTLSLMNNPSASSTIRTLLLNDIQDDWVQIMALAATVADQFELINYIRKHIVDNQRMTAKSFITKACEMIGQSNDHRGVKSLIQTTLSDKSTDQQWWKSAALMGLAEGLKKVNHLSDGNYDKEKSLLLGQFNPGTNVDIRRQSMELLSALGLPAQGQREKINLSVSVLKNENSSPPLKIDALQLLKLAGPEHYIDLISGLIIPTEAIEVQKAALRALNTIDYETFPIDEFVFDQWQTFTPALQGLAIELMAKKGKTTWALLQQVRLGGLHSADIPWKVKFRILNHKVDSIKSEARKLLVSTGELSDEVMQQYEKALSEAGDREKGSQIFARVCSTCHQMGGKEGIDFGPDLASIRNRTKNAILNDVLFPNQSIADGYGLWEVELKDGKKLYGIIAQELNDQLSLKDASGAKTVVQREEISQLIPVKTSGMPEGLDQQISSEEMKHLLTYLKRPF